METPIDFLSMHLESYAYSVISGDDRPFLKYLYNVFFKRFSRLSLLLSGKSTDIVLMLNQCHGYSVGSIEAIIELVGTENGSRAEIMEVYDALYFQRRVSKNIVINIPLLTI